MGKDQSDQTKQDKTQIKCPSNLEELKEIWGEKKKT